MTAHAGVGDAGMGMNAVFGDYDNDGDRDLYVVNWGQNVLYRNNGDGTFTDMTERTGVGHEGFGSSAAFSDYDHDGDLDLYLTNYLELSQLPSEGRLRYPWDFPGAPNVLYRNNGRVVGRSSESTEGWCTFTDVTEAAGVAAGDAKSIGVLFTDYDNDRDVDFYVINVEGPNLLYTNNRDGTFAEVASKAKIEGEGRTLAAAVGDYDKDGYMDFCLTNWGRAAVLYRNDKDGRFSKQTLGGAAQSRKGRSVHFIDYDNDGDLDLAVLGAGQEGNRGVLLRNRGNGTFAHGNLDFELKGGPSLRSSAGDYDNDGDVDLLSVSSDGSVALLRNDGGNQHNWLKVEPKGFGSNKDGIGAKVEVKSGALWQKVEVRGGSRDSGLAQFGLGKRDQVDLVRILWPGGVRQAELNLPANRRMEITEVDRKGSSCPILYVWDGSSYRFVTDILAAAIIGYPTAAGQYYYPDTDEYVKIDGALMKKRGSVYSIQIVNQLEEVIYLDEALLFAVDHPREVDMYPKERQQSAPPYPSFRINVIRDPKPPVSAQDDRGRDILSQIREKDGVYLEGFAMLASQLHHEMPRG